MVYLDQNLPGDRMRVILYPIKFAQGVMRTKYMLQFFWIMGLSQTARYGDDKQLSSSKFTA